MKPLAIDLRGAKKIAGDKHSSTFNLKNGHQMKFVHSALPALQRKQMEKMPVHLADGGILDSIADGAKSAFNYVNDALALPDEKTAAVNPIPEREPQSIAPPRIPQAAPAAQAVSPAPLPVAPDSSSGGVDVAGAYNQGQQGISEAQNVASQNANANAAVQQSDLDSRKQINDEFQKNLGDIQNHQKQYIQDYAAGHIDPKHYMENMGTGQKVATAIGLLLGGFTGGFNKTGVNPALQYLQQQQERDIQAQQSGLDQKKTLLGANQDLYKDAILGQQATRINQNDMLDHQIQLQASKTGSAAAKAAADQAHSHFALENSQLLQNMAMRKTALDQLKNPNSAADPAALVRYLVPEPHQKAVFDEIDRAKDTRTMAGSILKAFDEAANDNTVLKTGGGMLRTPPTVGALHQAMQPTFKDLEGTVRQAAMDNTFKNITPAPGDLPSSIKTKREALVDYLHSKASAATAKGFGIDLDKFASTRPPQQAPQIKTVNGVKYQRGPNGEAIRVN